MGIQITYKNVTFNVQNRPSGFLEKSRCNISYNNNDSFNFTVSDVRLHSKITAIALKILHSILEPLCRLFGFTFEDRIVKVTTQANNPMYFNKKSLDKRIAQLFNEKALSKTGGKGLNMDDFCSMIKKKKIVEKKAAVVVKTQAVLRAVIGKKVEEAKAKAEEEEEAAKAAAEAKAKAAAAAAAAAEKAAAEAKAAVVVKTQAVLRAVIGKKVEEAKAAAEAAEKAAAAVKIQALFRGKRERKLVAEKKVKAERELDHELATRLGVVASNQHSSAIKCPTENTKKNLKKIQNLEDSDFIKYIPVLKKHLSLMMPYLTSQQIEIIAPHLSDKQIYTNIFEQGNLLSRLFHPERVTHLPSSWVSANIKTLVSKFYGSDFSPIFDHLIIKNDCLKAYIDYPDFFSHIPDACMRRLKGKQIEKIFHLLTDNQRGEIFRSIPEDHRFHDEKGNFEMVKYFPFDWVKENFLSIPPESLRYLTQEQITNLDFNKLEDRRYTPSYEKIMLHLHASGKIECLPQKYQKEVLKIVNQNSASPKLAERLRPLGYEITKSKQEIDCTKTSKMERHTLALLNRIECQDPLGKKLMGKWNKSQAIDSFYRHASLLTHPDKVKGLEETFKILREGTEALMGFGAVRAS